MAVTNDDLQAVAREAILRVLAHLPAGIKPNVKRHLIHAAYPFGEKEGPKYRLWLREVREAVPLRRPASAGCVCLELRDHPRRWWLAVRCYWCDDRPGACIVCGPWHDRLHALMDSPEWREWVRQLREDPTIAPIVGDWLEDHGAPDLAEQFRSWRPKGD